jgi:hypothetical protein
MMIVISCSEDGDKTIYRLTKAEALKRLNDPDHWGNTKFASANEMPEMDYFVGLIIIDGDIVTPKPAKTVTEWSL